jgi:hypothetical protein
MLKEAKIDIILVDLQYLCKHCPLALTGTANLSMFPALFLIFAESTSAATIIDGKVVQIGTRIVG